MSTLPISSPLISVRRGSACFFLHFEQVVADDVADVLVVGQDPQILGDFVEQIAIFAGQLLLLEIDQLAERHAEDGVGLHGGERVALGVAALGDERLEADVAQRPGHQRRRGI